MFAFLFLFSLSGSVLSHLILNEPQVWGVNDGIALEQPLDQNTQNWMCAGKQPDTNSVINLVAGQTYSFQTICGEQNINAPGCLIGDWHTGNNNDDYSGCALSVSYSDYTNPDNHKYISYSQDCPKRQTDTTFIISPNVQNCERCVCSWGWAPSRDYSSPAQFYHNCFYCSISGGNNATMKQFDFINVRDASYTDRTYNDIVNPDEIYSSVSSTPSTSTPTTVSSTSTRIIPTVSSTPITVSSTTSTVSSTTTTVSSTTSTRIIPTVSSTPTCNKRRTVTVVVTVTPSPTCISKSAYV
jgi:hypothetical protein